MSREHYRYAKQRSMVGVRGFEPRAPCSQSRCSDQTELHTDKRKWWRQVDSNHRAIKTRFTVGCRRPLSHTSKKSAYWRKHKESNSHLFVTSGDGFQDRLLTFSACSQKRCCGVPCGIRTRVDYVKDSRPRPLDERDVFVRTARFSFESNQKALLPSTPNPLLQAGALPLAAGERSPMESLPPRGGTTKVSSRMLSKEGGQRSLVLRRPAIGTRHMGSVPGAHVSFRTRPACGGTGPGIWHPSLFNGSQLLKINPL